MSISKKSQLLDSLDGSDILMEQALLSDENDLKMDDFAKKMPSLFEDISIEDSDLGDGEVLLEVNPDRTLTFTLDKVPGGIDQEDIVQEEEIAVEEPEEVVVDDDPWTWSVKEFLPWLSKMMKGVPSHSGKDTVGLERAIAYLQKVDKEISKAVRQDYNNNIDISSVEQARDELQRGVERLEDRYELVSRTKYKKNKGKGKKADDESDELVKEAQKAAHVGGHVVAVPLFISGLARTLINGMVSGGHDIEDMFKKLDKKFTLTAREKAEVMQLLADMNYPVRRDRGFLTDEEIDTRSSDNFDWAANYQA